MKGFFPQELLEPHTRIWIPAIYGITSAFVLWQSLVLNESGCPECWIQKGLGLYAVCNALGIIHLTQVRAWFATALAVIALALVVSTVREAELLAVSIAAIGFAPAAHYFLTNRGHKAQ